MLTQIISAEYHILCPPLQDSLSFTWCLVVDLYICSNQLIKEVSLMTVMVCSNIREYQSIIWNNFIQLFFWLCFVLSFFSGLSRLWFLSPGSVWPGHLLLAWVLIWTSYWWAAPKRSVKPLPSTTSRHKSLSKKYFWLPCCPNPSM